MIVGGDKLPLRIVGFLQIFNNGAGLCQRQIAIDNHWRLAERMDLFQLRRRQHGLRIALIALHLVRHSQFFQKPQDALRPRVI
ncbi:hypothetical protein D3C87_1973950 [compost metagenome]